MSNHIDALFEGQDLSEEFKVKATAIIEAAIDETRTELTAKLQEEADTKLQARIVELEAEAERYIAEEIVPQVDKYLTAAVTEWAKDNAVALEEAAKVELAESFLNGLVGLAESHNLNIPQGTFDKVSALEQRIVEMRDELNANIDRNIELQNENKEFVRKSIIQKVTSELSESQVEKIVAVGAKVEFVSESQFTDAVKSLVESYFPASVNEDLNKGDDSSKVKDEPEKNVQLSESYAARLISASLNE